MAAMRQLLARLVRDGRIAACVQLASKQPLVCASRGAQWCGRSAARGFSSKGLNGVNGLNGDHHGDEDEHWDDVPINGDASPFERLLQHSQKFRDEVGLDDLPEGVEEDVMGEVDREDATEEMQDEHRDDAQADDDDKLGATLEEIEGGHAEFVGEIRKPHASHSHHRAHAPRAPREHHHQSHFARRWGMEERVRRRIASTDDIDFEHGLRDLDERRAKEKMYVQLLAREYDRDRVCQNCGEPGHVARNCMLPVICSNCGDVGHRRNECPHRSYCAEQFAATKIKSKPTRSPKKSEEQLKAETRRRAELQAIKERHERLKKAFDDELDEYLDRYETVKKTRDERAQTSREGEH